MKQFKKIVILTGAGISAESGLATFRASNGLWNNHRVEDVATIEAFERNPAYVHAFYNELKTELVKAKPNAAHQAITRLQDLYPAEISVVPKMWTLSTKKPETKTFTIFTAKSIRRFASIAAIFLKHSAMSTPKPSARPAAFRV